MITIYTDGALNKETVLGGWATIVVNESGEETVLTGNQEKTSANRMYLLAALKGLFTLSKPTKVNVVTYSQYVGEVYNQSKFRKLVEDCVYGTQNYDLLNILYNLDQIHEIKITVVKGAGYEYNERCQELAAKETKKARGPRFEKPKEKYYAVAVGRKTGIFSTWEECNKQVLKYKGAKYKKFDKRSQAESFINKHEKLQEVRKRINSSKK